MLWIILGVVVLLLALVAAFLVTRARRNTSPISIVMLRSTPRRFTESDIRGAFRRIHKRDPRIEKMSPDPTTDAFLVLDEELPTVGVIDSRRMYADKDDMEESAARCEHPLAREALTGHTAWVSVDAMGIDASIGKEKRAKVYTLLAPLAAELLDDQCMLLYLPAENRVAKPGPGTERLLRDGQIAELFDDDDLHAPLFQVKNEDEEVNAAIEKARKRLPEFCMAWERLGDKTKAMVKGRFAVGDKGGNEYIWIKVTGMTDAGFTGTIENNPIAPGLPRKGTTVTVKLDDVVDWAYIDEKEKPHGLFVDRVLIARGHR